MVCCAVTGKLEITIQKKNKKALILCMGGN
jgi:hypothetical protein